MSIKLNKIQRLIICLAAMFLLLSLAPAGVHAYDGLETKNFDVTCTVNKDKTYDIKENIKMNFKYPKHGIERRFHGRQTMRLPEGNIAGKNHYAGGPVVIRDFEANVPVKIEESTSKYSSGSTYYRLGDPKKEVKGMQEYNISYKIVPDTSIERDGYDEVFVELKPDYWSSSIENYSFTVVFPEKIKHKNVAVYLDKAADDVTPITDYKIYDENGKTYVKYSTKNVEDLPSISLFAMTPEDYFEKEDISYSDKFAITFLIASFVFFLMALICKILARKPNKILDTTELYPPRSYDPALMAVLFGNIAYTSDSTQVITAMITYLANKGYITIERVEIPRSNGKPQIDFTITKTEKEINDSLSSTYRRTLKYLFAHDNQIRLSTVQQGTWINIYNELQGLYAKNFMPNTTDKKTDKLFRICLGTLIIIAIAIFLTPKFIGVRVIGLAENLGLMLLCLLVATIALNSYVKEKRFNNSKTLGALKIIVAILMFGLASSCIASIMEEALDYSGSFYTVLSRLCLIIGCILTASIASLDKKYAILKGQLNSFERFVKNADEKQIESLVYENPNYMFTMLPYAYVFDCDEKWIRHTNRFTKKIPDWYIVKTDKTEDEKVFELIYSLSDIKRAIYGDLYRAMPDKNKQGDSEEY